MPYRRCLLVLLLLSIMLTVTVRLLSAAQTKPAAAFGRGPAKEATPEFLEAAVQEADRSLASDDTHDEWPAAAAGPDDRVAVAWVAFDDEADRLIVAEGRVGKAGRLERAQRQAIAGPGAIVMPALAYDQAGRLWAVWCARDGDAFDLYARCREEESWGKQLRLTDDAGPDSRPCLACDRAGTVWLVWQGFRGGSFDILIAQLTDTGLRQVQSVTSHKASDWQPAIAVGADGAVHVAWDTYRNSSYDVYLRTCRDGKWSDEIPVAATPAREAHPSLAVAPDGAVWIGYDVGEEKWGQHVRLHGKRSIETRCVRNGRIGEPKQPFQMPFRPERQPKQEWPHLTIDRGGRLWVGFLRYASAKPKPARKSKGKTRRRRRTRGVFWQYATCFDGQKWSPPVALAASSGRGHDRLRLATLSSGQPFAVWASDGRRLPYNEVGIIGNIFCAPLADEPPTEQTSLVAHSLRQPEVSAIPSDPICARPRQKTVSLGRAKYALVFGDTHRHTDLSRCNYRGDGTLMDAYRYAIDVAALDFLAISDHDQDLNGWRCKEPCPALKNALWWRSQKYADLHTMPSRFLALYGYERGRTMIDGGGHKNVVYWRRGLPVLSMNPQKEFFAALANTEAVVIPHQLADGKDATAWDKWDADYERVAEIYQARGSYENTEAPRRAKKWTDGHSLADAYRKGVRIGIIASSDHGLTHNAFAGVYVTEFTKRAIVQGLRARRTFGATELVELSATLNGKPMGMELSVDGQPRIEATVRAYEPLKQVDVIKDNRVVYSLPVEGIDVKLAFADTDLPPGQEAYYYVRVSLKGGAQAWSSPFWVKRGN